MRFLRSILTGRRAVVLGGAALCLAFALWIRLGPVPSDLGAEGAPSSVVVDRHGVPLYEALSGDGTRNVTLRADQLPQPLVDATVAAEDHRFWSHRGVDLLAIARAFAHNLRARRVVEGGSTISQQVAKLLLTRREPRRRRGLGAKVREAVLALRLEHRHSKREILAMYLNLASYGGQVVGAERASRAYFGRTASMLTPAQAAFLAGLPQRPSGFNPYRNRQAAIVRQRGVLGRMAAAAMLTRAQAAEARAEELVFARAQSPFSAPHFVEMVLAGAGDSRPARIETTLDANLQADIGGIIRGFRPELDRHGAANVAVIVLDNRTAEWRAWEGSGDYADAAHGGTINGPVTPRQPGSALKPFTYALAFEEGLGPATVLADVPSHFPTAEPGVLYSPRNYDGRYRGPLLARRALAGSENVPAVALASSIGVPKLLRFLMRAGLTTFDRTASYYGLGVTLGNAEVRLDEMVAAYSAFARGGEWIAPTWLANVPSTARPRRPIVSRRTSFWITDILSDPDAREFIFGRGGSLEFPFPVAVKTGTSQAYHDNWTVGYSRDVTVGVWVGNFDRAPLRDSTGVTGAGPIFHAVMLAAERRAGMAPAADGEAIVAAPETSDGVTSREICALSGMAANPWCPTRTREWIAAGATLMPCSWHHLAEEGLLVFWPPEYHQWARSAGLMPGARQAVDRPRGATGPAPSRRAALAVVSPPDGATYLIDPTLRREFQALAMRVVTAEPGAITWFVDDREVGTIESAKALSWPLTAGAHHFVARDLSGRTARASITAR